MKNKQLFEFNGKQIELETIDGKKDVFVSYKRENVRFIARLVVELNHHNISTWFDMDELHEDVGKDYTKRIHHGIDMSAFFLLIYSKEVENSDFIINEELEYAIKKRKTILFYPHEPIDLKTSKIAKYVEKIQWLDTKETAVHQRDIQEAIHDEKKKAQLTALTNTSHGFTIFDDQNIFLIRIALQKLLHKYTSFGNYMKLCGTDKNEVLTNKSLRLRVINKSLIMDVPQEYYEKLERMNFFKKTNEDDTDTLPEVERHLSERNPDNKELIDALRSFLLIHQDIYPMNKLHDWFVANIKDVKKYDTITLPAPECMNIDTFFLLVQKMTACSFIHNLQQKKTLFNGTELGVYEISDTRTTNVEDPFIDVQLYYSDYFTFQCMTEMYHILCSMDATPFIINSVADIKRLAPFLCSLGLGGFVVAYHKGVPNLMWTKRSEKISSGDMWHFSYDETVSLLKDSVKDEENHIVISKDGTVHLDINQILFRALEEEVGVKRQIVSEENHGVFEIGIIRSERLEIEILSYTALHLPDEPSLYEQIKIMHDAASDGYLEISKIHFTPVNDLHTLISNLLTPESYNIAKRLGERLINNVGKGVTIGKGVSIETDSTVGNNVTIGDYCKIHHNVHIDNDVMIGKYCKIQNNNSIYKGVTLEDGVFIGTNVSFTNDMYPRAIRRSDGIQVQKDDWELKTTRVCHGASIGSGAVIRCGITIGEWAMVGCGAVVLHDVPAGSTVVGNPARIICFDNKF